MNEEEKKAIETLKSWKDYNIRNKNKLLQADEIINVQEIILNLIEKLQKENESLKAKLEYKEYGDLDNAEFEKYINDIIESKTKELKEQLEEEQELNKIIKETRINKVLENNIEVKKLREENENLRKELNAENKRCMMLAVEKQDYLEKYEYHKKQNESLSKEFSNCISILKLKEEVLNPMKEAHDKAIKGFIKTDAPECVVYSAIAQELVFFIGKIEELLKSEG